MCDAARVDDEWTESLRCRSSSPADCKQDQDENTDPARARKPASVAALPEWYAALRVVARVRPPSAQAAHGSVCLEQLAPDVLQATLVEKNKLVRSNVRGQAPRSTTFMSTRTFAFDAAFPPAAQTLDLFQAEVLPLVDMVVRSGASCCIMAYGATGSGKTHTLTGSPSAPDGEGVLHMVAAELCARVHASNAHGGGAVTASRLSMYCTAAEVYMDELLDLGPVPHDAPADFKFKRFSTATLKRVPVAGADELVAAVAAMLQRRAAGATNKNAHSSRSHAIYTIALERGGAPFAQLALVDLAGAEYAAATEGKEDVRRLEGGKNNLGLMSLKAAFRHVGAATAGAASVAPAARIHGNFTWHRSKLTAALRPFFTDPDGRVLLVITASPDVVDAAQTSQTLEEGVTVAGRAMAAKAIVELTPPPPPPTRFLRVGGGKGGGKGVAAASSAAGGDV